MCEKFLIHVHFKELTILNVDEDLEHKEISIDVELENAKIESKIDNFLTFKDGSQEVDAHFILQAEDMIDNEDFMFTSLGRSLNVNLSCEVPSLTKSSKKLKQPSFKKKIFAKGKIELLKLMQQEKLEYFIMLETSNKNMEMALNFEIRFENSPQISSILSIGIESFYNFNMSHESIEACIRFPFNENFRAAMMEKSKSFQQFSSLHLIDDKLNSFEVSSSINVELFYENYQNEIGLKFFHQLIESRQSLLIEIRVDQKMMMSFIELDVFNYQGVNDVIFISPLYEWNKNLIKELFQQEACFKDEKLATKKETRNSSRKKLSEIEEPDSLVPVEIDGKQAAISIRIKFSSPLKPAKELKDLELQLCEKLNLINSESSSEKALRESNESFKLAIENLANELESFLEVNPHAEGSALSLLRMIESFKEESELKDAIKALIGNSFNIERETVTNHEFKLLMIDVYKSLNKEMLKILNEKWARDEKSEKIEMDTKLRKTQIDEWLAINEEKKAQEIIDNELKNCDDIRKLEELAFYQFKMGKLLECEETIMKILKKDHLNTFGLYFMSYLAYDRSDTSLAIFLMEILLKLFPQSLEFMTLLKSLYEEINFSAGAKFCKIHLKSGQFIPLYGHPDLLFYPEIISSNALIKILHQQLNFKLEKFIKITKSSIDRETFEMKVFNTIKALEDNDHDKASDILKSIEMTDCNEIVLRILKGHLLYSTCNKWRGICEYEIAYNLCLKKEIKCPHMVALRCGQWYLNDMKNTTKARRYFHHCCKNFGTFNSWQGLGVVSFYEMGHKNAEKYITIANQICKKAPDNWAYLALVNIRLNRIDIAVECYMTAKSLGDHDSSNSNSTSKPFDAKPILRRLYEGIQYVRVIDFKILHEPFSRFLQVIMSALDLFNILPPLLKHALQLISVTKPEHLAFIARDDFEKSIIRRVNYWITQIAKGNKAASHEVEEHAIDLVTEGEALHGFGSKFKLEKVEVNLIAQVYEAAVCEMQHKKYGAH